MKTDSKFCNLPAVWKWGQYYIEQVETLVEKADVKTLKQLRDELWEFMYGVKSRRLVDRRLSSSTKENLRKLYENLQKSEQLVATRITEVQRNQEIIKRIETIAVPEPTEKVTTIDFSTWAMWPLRYSQRLLDKLADARVPQ